MYVVIRTNVVFHGRNSSDIVRGLDGDELRNGEITSQFSALFIV